MSRHEQAQHHEGPWPKRPSRANQLAPIAMTRRGGDFGGEDGWLAVELMLLSWTDGGG